MPKSVADRLRAAIQAELDRGTSLREIARRADVDHTIIGKFHKGGDIRLSSAEAIAKALGVTTG